MNILTTKIYSGLVKFWKTVKNVFLIVLNFRRGPGAEYLKDTLEAPIRSVIEENDLDLEINPMKVLILHFCWPIGLSLEEVIFKCLNTSGSFILQLSFISVFVYEAWSQ